MITGLKSAFIAACAAGAVLSAQDAFAPARYQAGTVPALPVTALSGGEVLVEISVGSNGRVTAVTPLRATPPFTDLVLAAVRGWQFLPASEDAGATPVPLTVLVAAVYRPPALRPPTLGEAPKDIASGSAGTAFPLTMPVPPFPPLARSSGVVLLEVRVDRNGAVADATVIRSAPAFDAAAQAAARQWTFRPARVRGRPVSTYVYLVFGFPIPVTPPPHKGE
jgi:TonB family protein